MLSLKWTVTYSGLHTGVSWERDHLGRLSKRAGRPRSQERTHSIDMENGEWQLLTTRTAAAKASARHMIAMVVGGSLSALTLVALASLIVARDFTKRQRAEEALRESEARYRTLFENASDGILTLTLDGTIASVNRAVEVMLSRSRQELIGHHFREVSTPAAAQEEERRNRAFALERLPSVYETEFIHKDGSIVPVEVRASFLRNEDGGLVTPRRVSFLPEPMRFFAAFRMTKS